MPNGAHYPQCEVCASVAFGEPEARCARRHFLIPLVGVQVICRDWRFADEYRGDEPGAGDGADAAALDEEFGGLAPGWLHYYSYASPAPPQPLARFAELQRPTRAVAVEQDESLGWAIFLEERQHHWLPAPGDHAVLDIDGAPRRFEVADVARPRLTGITPTGPATATASLAVARVRVAHCPADPAALHRWLARYLDIDAFVAAECERVGGDAAAGRLMGRVSAFIQVVQPHRRYALLRPAVPHGYQYRRPPP